jgi:hypothetical protein
MRIFFLTIFLSALVGCVSRGYLIDNQNYSLGDLKKTLVAIIGEPRQVSENQRTIYSRYFSRRPDSRFDPEKSPERLYAAITILGDRRPYNVQIEVIAEIKEGSSYVSQGSDEIETNKLGRGIRTRLNQGREERNIIDDFRAF